MVLQYEAQQYENYGEKKKKKLNLQSLKFYTLLCLLNTLSAHLTK